MWPFSSGYPTRTPESVASQTFDYIVVGGGTAGCVLASKLSEDPNVSVLLLERGPVVDTWASKVPLLSVDYRPPTAPKYGWLAAPLAAAVGTPPLEMISGKLLGGTSKINAFVYARSVPGEYNAWAEAGRTGWSWEEVEPYFKGMENVLSYKNPHRGDKGPWKLRKIDTVFFENTPAVIKATSALDIPFLDEANDPSAPSTFCNRADLALNEKGQRQSTFDAFLPPEVAWKRQKNLFVVPQVVVSKLDLQPSANGTRAVGVYFQRDSITGGSSATQFYVSARHEIVLCSGAIASPQVLMLSGVGPAEHLREHNIPVVKDLPGVGSELQDHVGIPLIYRIPPDDSLYKLERSPLFGLKEMLKYIFFGRGIFLFPNPQLFVFAQSQYLDQDFKTVLPDASASNAHLASNVPDIEIMHIPYCAWEFRKLKDDEGAMSFFCVLLKPHSRGTVRLTSVDPCSRPACDLNFLSDARDWPTLRKAVRLGLALGRKVEEGGYPLGNMLQPEDESDAGIDAFVRKSVRTTYHYSSTCRMAPEAEGGVVDDELRVHGIEGLRIADASIFPTIPATHLQAPAAMVAARCADFLKNARFSK
ncbi:uncharacterized protein PHACADRAFT_186585 [Phanerochaete carnosa HHB-10118-sp]|uniref:Glucose-methanol-choline oxidoreductase N-terminal domain-containing protein n=1 Tax=Phanerochaete carnosa (strain HHB-10118-sp) TaxID=650164 RepID=K5W029_PHACS|nr:uncharacterized protein PHACADRAFT_186585 [Phanerochaete carnosa HHB-10118-sp]EKM52435.1 hypothetical protein PHACADRAFT_186585 [Phanerochaete carnosa HHB-10118-sp]